MSTYRIREAFRWVKDFVPRALAGFEPVAARAFLASIFAALALTGIGTGELPAWAETTLAALTIIVPALLGLNARGKVSPVDAIPEQDELGDDDENHDLAPALNYATPLDDMSAGDAPTKPAEPGEHRADR